MRSISSRGPIVFTYTLSVFENGPRKKKVTAVAWFCPSFLLEMFYLRKDERDGTDGDQKGPLIFFILRYIKHYTNTR